MHPLVSVVIPTYNRSALLNQAIESALTQTYGNIEVIVIDDGSTDDTEAVSRSFGDRIRYYRKPNGGAASALNLGIKNMRGEWFKWLSSDDLLSPDAVETLVRYAEEKGAQIVYTDYDIIDSNGNFDKKFLEPHYSHEEYAAALRDHFVGNGSSTLIHRSCFEKVGMFDESLRKGEDYDWWLRACITHGYRFHHCPKVTLKYRWHDGQLTRQRKEHIG